MMKFEMALMVEMSVVIDGMMKNLRSYRTHISVLFIRVKKCRNISQ